MWGPVSISTHCSPKATPVPTVPPASPPTPTPKPRPHLPSGRSAPPTALLGLGAPWLASWGGAPRDLSLARPPPVSVLPNLRIFLQTLSQFPSPQQQGQPGVQTVRNQQEGVFPPPAAATAGGLPTPPPPARPAGRAPRYACPPKEKGPVSTVGTCVGGRGQAAQTGEAGAPVVQSSGEPRCGPRWGAQPSLEDPSLCCGPACRFQLPTLKL